MSERAPSETDRVAQSADAAGVETIEAYDTADGLVLYDAENPLAWVEGTVHCSLEAYR